MNVYSAIGLYQPLIVSSVGMVSPVGLNAPASCAAIRARVARYEELPFHDRYLEWIIGAPITEAGEDREYEELLALMLCSALNECLEGTKGRWVRTEPTPLLLAIGEPHRPDFNQTTPERLLAVVRQKLGVSFQPVQIFSEGKVGFFRALQHAGQLLEDRKIKGCVVAAVDSFINAEVLQWLEWQDRLKISANSDGVIPGEAAAAMWVCRKNRNEDAMIEIRGLGFGEELSVLEEDAPNRAEGLSQAIRLALDNAALQLHEIDFRVAGMTGERTGFMEASTALAKIQRIHKDHFVLWVPAEILGDVGAALPACMMVVTAVAMARGYAPGQTALLYIASDMCWAPPLLDGRPIPLPYHLFIPEDIMSKWTVTKSANSSSRAACVVTSPQEKSYGQTSLRKRPCNFL